MVGGPALSINSTCWHRYLSSYEVGPLLTGPYSSCKPYVLHPVKVGTVPLDTVVCSGYVDRIASNWHHSMIALD